MAACLACTFALPGCTSPQRATSEPAVVAPATTSVTQTRAQYLMGTIVDITAVAPTEAAAQAALTAGFEEIRRLEQMLSTWIDTSELSQVNRAAGHSPVQVSAETFELLTIALDIAAQTDGAFNIAIGPAVRLWRVTEAQRVPSDIELAIAGQYVDYHMIQLNPAEKTVYLEKPGMQIDVGGIGKGFTAEKVAAVMRRNGATGALIAVSGDFRIFGRRADGSSWPVGIQHPRKPGHLLATIDSTDEAVSTSGDYERFFLKDGVRYHHILDPATLKPARLCQSVTIVADNAVLADGYATGIFVLGPVRGLALAERLRLGAAIVDADGRLNVSNRLAQRLKSP